MRFHRLQNGWPNTGNAVQAIEGPEWPFGLAICHDPGRQPRPNAWQPRDFLGARRVKRFYNGVLIIRQIV